MELTNELKHIESLQSALMEINATQRDKYSWVAKTKDCFVFTAEVDHFEQENNKYNHTAGEFRKIVPSLSTHLSSSAFYVRELYDALNLTFCMGLRCKLVLLTGAINGTNCGGIKAAIDEGDWVVHKLIGSPVEGYEFHLIRINPENEPEAECLSGFL